MLQAFWSNGVFCSKLLSGLAVSPKIIQWPYIIQKDFVKGESPITILMWSQNHN